MIALDTTALIDLWKNDPAVREAVASATDRIATTSANCHEVMVGLDTRYKAQKREYDFYRSIFEQMEILDHNLDAAEQATDLLAELKAKGSTISGFDVMIAGILRARGVTKILTRNAKHFEAIDGLEPVPY